MTINDAALEYVIATPVGPQPNSFYDPADGRQYLKMGTRASKAINNFKTQIVKEVDIILGGGKAQRSLVVRCTLLSGKSTDITLEARHLKSSAALENALGEMLTRDFIVYDKMYGHLKVAMQELSLEEGWERVQAIATTGWIVHGGGLKFILPSANGAITKDGIDPNIVFDYEYLPYELRDGYKKLAGYGKGVRPALNDEERLRAAQAFHALIECAPPQVTIPAPSVQVVFTKANAGFTDEVLTVKLRSAMDILEERIQALQAKKKAQS